MFARILVVLLITPIIELGLLIKLGELIGFWPTIAIIVTTALAGSMLLKREGLSVWRRFNDRLTSGDMPGTEALDGVIIIVAGALLITPGVLTDLLGFLGLLPITRKLIRKEAMKRIRKAMTQGTFAMGFGAFDDVDLEANGVDYENTWEGNPRETPRYIEDAPAPESRQNP